MCSGPNRSEWSLQERVKLLAAIEKFQFGNWKVIAEEIGTRNATETKKEYISNFLEGAIGRATWSVARGSRPKLQNLVNNDDSPLAFSKFSSTLPYLDILPQEAIELHYNILRDEFEIEYDNQAEKLVSSLKLSKEDDDLDIALKLTQVDVYTEKLRQRKRRHRVIRDYQLVASFFRQKRKIEKKMTKVEAFLRKNCFKFCQFHTCEEHEQFVHSMVNQYKLAHKLKKLFLYRQSGVTKFDSLRNCDAHMISRQIHSHNFSVKRQLISHKLNEPRKKKIKKDENNRRDVRKYLQMVKI